MIFNKLIQKIRRYRNKKLYLKIYFAYLNKQSCEYPLNRADDDFGELLRIGIITSSQQQEDSSSESQN